MRPQTCPDAEVILAIKNVLVARSLRGATKASLLDDLAHLERDIWYDNLRVRLGINHIRRVFFRDGT